MSSRDFLYQTLLIVLLVLISTGLSLFDKESRFNKLNNADSPGTAGLVEIPLVNTNSIQAPGGGVKEDTSGGSETPFVKPEIAPGFLPLRDWNIPDPLVTAEAAIMYRPSDDKIFYQKNLLEPLPIASITKLMTAIAIVELIELDEVILVSKNAVETDGAAGNLVVGEEISARNLLYALIIESSNDAATAFNEYIENTLPGVSLVDYMNRRAEEIGLLHTSFKNPSGLDSAGSASNFSSVADLATLGAYISQNEPDLLAVTGIRVINVLSIDGWHNHHLVNSNTLLGVIPEVIGGKTGYTKSAEESLLTIFSSPSPHSDEFMISVVLKSKNRAEDTKILLSWLKNAYLW